MNLFNPCYSWESLFPSSHFPYNLKRDITLITSLASLCCFSAQFKMCNSAKVQQSSHFHQTNPSNTSIPRITQFSVFLLFCLSIDTIQPSLVWHHNSFPFTFVSICLYCVWTDVKLVFPQAGTDLLWWIWTSPSFPLKLLPNLTHLCSWEQYGRVRRLIQADLCGMAEFRPWVEPTNGREKWKRRGNSVIGKASLFI